MNLSIIVEKNAARLSALGYITFDQAFRAMNRQEDFETYLARAFSLKTMSKELVDTRGKFFIALHEDEPVGYFKLYAGPAPECVTAQPAIELVRFYALKSHWGKGVGPAMMEHALERARARGFAAVWLSSWQQNDRGNAFYRKWGFDAVGEQTFTLGRDVQQDFIMSRRL